MPVGSVSRLAVLKTLGDNTRYAIYLELARSPSPLTTAEIAESLDLHANTVRPHLDRMREVGLLQVATESRGGVGRPHHRYSLDPNAPSLGLEPPTMPLLARMLVGVAAATGVDPDDAAAIGREQGRAAAAELVGDLGLDADDADLGAVCLEALAVDLDRLGFDPAVAEDSPGQQGAGVTVAFTHCPFAELAEAHPEIVCHLHRGMVEGLVDAVGGATVERFGTRVARNPCQVELMLR